MSTRGSKSGGRIADKYELVELAGEGGMATVWRGFMHGAAGFRRPVAIKRIRSELMANPEFVAMFVEEARLGSQLLHSNIVQVYDFERDEKGAYFLVLEWVEGLDFRRYWGSYTEHGQRSPWPLVVAIGIETLRGLSAAHERVDDAGRKSPVIHRDVTPHNILIGTTGLVKLSDFGLARAMDRARMTRPEIVKGKLAYLAPEIVSNVPASAQSDIYGLGVVLWEALAGRQLYEGVTNMDVLLKVRAADAPPLTLIRDDLPLELVAAVGRALATAPEERFPAARDFLRTLTQILRGVHQSTDSYALGHSVIEARIILGMPPPGIFVAPRGQPPPVPPDAGRGPRKRIRTQKLSETDLIPVTGPDETPER
jgi:serine/threonine-protein kinase